MKLWTVRAGRNGEQEATCLEEGVIFLNETKLPDLRQFKSREELFKKYREVYEASEEESNVKIGIQVGQIWRFANDIAVNDIVALPSKFQPIIHIGRVASDYNYKNKSIIHWKSVEWLAEISRSSFDQDLLYSFGSLLTISQVSRAEAVERVLAMVGKKKTNTNTPINTSNLLVESQENFNIERFAKDQIIKAIDRKFKGHEFTVLVNEILKAQGFTTKVSHPGADGGIDILASSGKLGFETPRICVQVKSTSAPADVKILRELQGVMKNVGADHGLLVSWGGFNNKVLSEAKDKFFFIRLWNADDVLNNMFQFYDKFSDSLKAELPLERFWRLIEEEE